MKKKNSDASYEPSKENKLSYKKTLFKLEHAYLN